MLYKIVWKDEDIGAVFVIDLVDGPVGYTAEDYIRDCREQSSPEWNLMLDHGKVSVYLYTEGEVYYE